MRFAVLPLVLLTACGDGSSEDTAGGEATATTGTLALTFRIDSDYRDGMDEPAIGDFHGAFWRGSDVTSLGPDAGAEDLGDIFVGGLDLTGDPSPVMFRSGELPIEEVVVLGFLDSDGNADPDSPDPDSKDPVTLPNDNDFDVIGGVETEVEVFLGFLNP